MQRNLLAFLAAVLVLAGFAHGEARAHPHVWVTIKSEVVYAPDGSATGVRHHWTFDEMFSVFATQGMDAKKPGGLTREDLEPLAEVNVTSLEEFEFFTFAKADGKPAGFEQPKDYWLEMTDGALTLHFTLPFKEPVKARKLELEIYDASFFVDFALGKEQPATLVDAPAACTVAAKGSRDNGEPPQQISESFFEALSGDFNFGAQFSNRISVACP